MFAGPIAGPVEIINNMSLGPFQVPYIYIYMFTLYICSLFSLSPSCAAFSHSFKSPASIAGVFPPDTFYTQCWEPYGVAYH